VLVTCWWKASTENALAGPRVLVAGKRLLLVKREEVRTLGKVVVN